jgi:hypothetical protein
MARLGKSFCLCLVVILAVYSLFIVEPATAQTEIVPTSCSISVYSELEGQPVAVNVQVYPAPPVGEVFNNLTVIITSPMQGVYGNGGNGPWSKSNISTDSAGRATVKFDITTFSGYWNAELYFGGEYLSNNTVYYQPCSQQIVFSVTPPETPPPAPPQNTPLGPLEILSQGGGGHSIQIILPQNQTSVTNPVTTLFCVRTLILSYSGFGNIGYSVDGGTVYSITEFMNKTIDREGFTDDTTIWANVTLPPLSDGPHSVTVYWGWYFPGGHQRYEVSAYTTASFEVNSYSNSIPSPTIPELSGLVIVPLLLSVFAFVLVIRYRKIVHG